ncbi:CSS-motif domain-containing protein [Escherichia coli]|uniref:CSS-motif domain-containing protein n=1 Tax=Escherichia coli TaxID=562 RepID=UPI003D816618
MFIRAPNSGRKLLLTCIVAGVMIAILVSCLQFLVAWHKHEVKYDTLITDVQKYLDTYFADLKSTTDRLQPLTLDTCQQANPELTARAAFSMNVRTFALDGGHDFSAWAHTHTHQVIAEKSNESSTHATQ